jgi:transcriptional regulator GlxA family with amidase domain
MGDRTIVAVVYDGFQLLDLAGPADVFATAALIARGGYRLTVAAAEAGPVRAHNGVTTTAVAFAELTEIDTLLVTGGLSAPQHLHLAGPIAELAGRARRVASVCNGALLLAEAGLLDGRRATTHWLIAEDLATRYPRVHVDADPIYVRDGAVWTSAGVTAGIDLALALVTEDHGSALAADVARGLVVYLHRPGGQSQFSTAARTATPSREPLRELRAYIDANPAADLSVPALARRAAMSERHFSRVFTRQVGMSPGRYVEHSRADAARRQLESTDAPLARVARDCGLGLPETLYRTFRRRWRISPADYRRRFRQREA